MNNSQLKNFLVAAKYENFTRAAEELYITQPVLGRQIAALEAELGITLFERHKKTVSLTPAGKFFADNIIGINAQLHSTVEKAKAIQSGENSIIKIGIAAGQILGRKTAEAINDLCDKYPDSEVLISPYTLSTMHGMLKNGEIDVALTSLYEITDDDEYNTQFINTNCNNLLLSDQHPMAYCNAKSLSDFKDITFLNVSDSESKPINENLFKFCANAGFLPKIRTIDNITQLPLYLETGKYAIIVNDECYINFLPYIIKFSLPEIPAATHIAAWKKGNPNNLLMYFITYLKEHPSDDRSMYIK